VFADEVDRIFVSDYGVVDPGGCAVMDALDSVGDLGDRFNFEWFLEMGAQSADDGNRDGRA